MKDRIFSVCLVGIFCLTVPYMLTVIINGRNGDVSSKIGKLDTGRDVIIHIEGQNRLIDVEEYILGVLPGIVSADAEAEVIEAQAVAVRTKIYYAMENNTIIDATKLDFTYYGEKELKDKVGEKNYNKMMTKYENAIENTVGKVM